MQQYSPKNQQFILSQLPTATDVRPFKAWKAAGRSVIKGEKALRVWIPKRGAAIPADLSTMTDAQEREYFVRGPVFDISQTKPCAPRHKAAANTERQIGAELDAMDRAYADYDAAIAAGEIPADLEFDIWYELREETRAADFNASLDAIVSTLTTTTIPASEPAGTLATAAGVVIAQYQHIDRYPPVSGGSDEADTMEQETAGAVSDHPIGCPCQDCTAGHESHEARITFHNAACHAIRDLDYPTLADAENAWFALGNGTATQIPDDWFTATLQTFDHGLPVTERAIYRSSGAVANQYRAELLEIGARSYQWSSHTPEKLAAYDADCFARMIDTQSSEWHAIATTSDAHALADQLTADYAAGYMAQYRKVAAARSRVASSFVTGPSGFNTRRNEKAQAAYAKRYDELDTWMQRFRRNAKRQIVPPTKPAATNPAQEDAVLYAADGVTITANYEINRYQIQHDEKPDDATRATLKAHGWHWSRQNAAWQRQITNAALYNLTQIVPGFTV